MKRLNRDFFAIEVTAGLIYFILCFFLNNTFIIIPYLILVFIFLKRKEYRYSPMIFFIIPWSFMFTMYCSDFITYSQGKTEYNAIMYMILGCLLVFLGYQLALKIRFNILRLECEKEQEINKKSLKKIKKLFNLTALIGFIGSLLFDFEMIFVTGIDFSTLASTRNTFAEHQATILSQLGNILSWGSIFTLPAIILLLKETNKFEKILWISSVLTYSMYSVLSAGRQVVFQILIIVIGTFLIKQNCITSKKTEKQKIKKNNRKVLWIVIIVFTIITSYMLKIANNRNDNKISKRKFEVLSYYMGCKMNPKVKEIYNSLPKKLADSISEAIVYYTHEIPGFNVFWNIDESIGPFWGMYSAPFIDRRMNSLGITSHSVEEKMKYVRNYMSSQGAMPVGWKTFFSFLILDYGRLGGLIYCIFYGFYVGYVYKNFMNKRTIISAIWLIRTCVGLFYTVMFPATCETGLLIMGIFCIFMNYIENKNDKYRYYIG